MLNSIPNDPDTRVSSQELLTIDGNEAVAQWWSWDGIYGNSIIFNYNDVQSDSDADLKSMVGEALDIRETANMTISRKTDNFIFVNYGFSEGLD